jgi:N-formylglutamate amidohydrolase
MDYLKFIKFNKGSIPLIISVPHGGMLECEDIPKRSSGIMGIDKGTIKLAEDLIKNIEHLSPTYFSIKKIPSYIISHVRRSKLDLNRKKNEAYSSDSTLAKILYQFYHSKIKEYVNYNLKSFNYSLLMDIHGFEKHKRPPGYRDVEIVLGTQNLSTFYLEPVPIKDRDKNLRGKIIKKFLELDIPIAPGHPRRREYILTGGYITQKYGISNIIGSQTMQIEFSDRIRIYDKNLRNKVLVALADLILRNLSKIN